MLLLVTDVLLLLTEEGDLSGIPQAVDLSEPSPRKDWVPTMLCPAITFANILHKKIQNMQYACYGYPKHINNVGGHLQQPWTSPLATFPTTP